MISKCTFASARWARDLEIASWPATRNGKFFHLFLSFVCWFVCWLLAISGSNQWRGVPMENKLPAAVATKPSRFGTRDLEIAGPKSWWFCLCCRWQFAFHRDSTPQKGHWNCEKSAHESTQKESKKLEKLTLSSARSASIIVDTQNVCFWIFNISIFRGYTHLKTVTFSSGCSRRTLRQEHDWSGYFSSILI